jgi:hypothetical protein
VSSTMPAGIGGGLQVPSSLHPRFVVVAADDFIREKIIGPSQPPRMSNVAQYSKRHSASFGGHTSRSLSGFPTLTLAVLQVGERRSFVQVVTVAALRRVTA